MVHARGPYLQGLGRDEGGTSRNYALKGLHSGWHHAGNAALDTKPKDALYYISPMTVKRSQGTEEEGLHIHF